MFDLLKKISHRPKPFEFYTTPEMWNDEHVSKKMLEFHLNDEVDLASRNRAFVDRSADWIISRFDIRAQSRICDFGCGPGLYTTRFAKTGAEVTGIDLSERSIQHARNVASQNGLSIDYVLQNYLQFDTDKRFDLVTMIYCDFCVLSPEQRKTLLGKLREFLAAGGAVLLDLLSLQHFDAVEEKQIYEFVPKDGFWSAAPYHVFSNIFKYDREKLVLDKYTIIEEAGTREIYNWLQCFSMESYREELEENGFRLVESYADVAGADYKPDATQFAVVAKKV